MALLCYNIYEKRYKNMKRVIYAVHSDEDENNVGVEFVGRGSKQKAISYAKSNGKCWVDKMLFDDRTCEYEYLGGVWN